MPIEVKQMTIQSNVTSTPADQTKQETVKPPCPDDGLVHFVRTTVNSIRP